MKKVLIILLLTIFASTMSIMAISCKEGAIEETVGKTAETVGKTAETVGKTAETVDGILIGITNMTMKETVYVFMRQGAMDEAEKQGVEVIWQSSENDPAVQFNQVQNFITKGIDALVIEPARSDAAGECVKLAKDAGIPVINIGALVTTVQTDLHLENNNYMFGKGQAEDFISIWGDNPANIIVLSGSPGDQSAEVMTSSLLEVLKKYPNYNVLDQQNHQNWDKQLAMNTMENALVKYNNKIDVVFSNNDQMALGAYKAAVNAGVGDKILFYGGDGDEDMIKLIADGNKNFKTYERGFENIGRQVVKNSLLLINGENVPYDSMETYGENNEFTVPWQWSPLTLITVDNVKEEMAKLNKWPDVFSK